MRTTTSTGARRSPRHRLLTALAGVALLGLAACGGGSSPGSADAGGNAAKASATGSAGGAASSATKPSSSSAKTPRATDLNVRVASAAKAKGTARIAMSGTTGQRASGAVRFTSSGVDFAMTVGTPGGKAMKMVVVAGTAYMNVGDKYQGKNWIRIAAGGSDPMSRVFGPIFAQLSTGLDLDTQLAGGKGAKITHATRATLGGVPVTKYTLVSSETGLLAQLDKFVTDPETRAALRAQLKSVRGESVLWISDENLPLRVDSRVVGGKVPGTATTVTYSDWGKPVSIAAPPADDTANLID
jgi:hypothetical protein